MSVEPRPPGRGPAHVARGRAGGQVGAGVGSGPPVSARAAARAALLRPHVHLHGLGCETLQIRVTGVGRLHGTQADGAKSAWLRAVLKVKRAICGRRPRGV